jgi:hypothetical protein
MRPFSITTISITALAFTISGIRTLRKMKLSTKELSITKLGKITLSTTALSIRRLGMITFRILAPSLMTISISSCECRYAERHDNKVSITNLSRHVQS